MKNTENTTLPGGRAGGREGIFLKANSTISWQIVFSMRWWWWCWWWWSPLCTRLTRLACFYSIVLVHWNNCPRMDLSPYSDTLSWFRTNQSFLFPRNSACLAKSNQYHFHNLWFDPIGAGTQDLQQSRRARYYTTDAVILVVESGKCQYLDLSH